MLAVTMRRRDVTRLERVNERGFFIDLIMRLNAKGRFAFFLNAGQDFF